MGCWEHNREFVGNCTWCGKQLCTICVAKEDGKKIYCRKCLNSLSEVKSFKEPKPLMRELNNGNMPKKTIKRIDSETYETDNGYRLKKPTAVETPKAIERPLPVEREIRTNVPGQNTASKNAMNFLEMQQMFDKKQSPNPKAPVQPRTLEQRQQAQPIERKERIEPLQKTRQPQQPQAAQRPLSQQPRPAKSFASVSDSSSKQAAQTALQFLAQQAQQTKENSKK